VRPFRRRRDGQIAVNLNDAGRDFVRHVFREIVAAEYDDDGVIHPVIYARITPGLDHDDPTRLFERQQEVSSVAERALQTCDDDLLNDSDAWAWLRTIQVALRSHAFGRDIRTAQDYQQVEGELRGYLESLQYLAWGLARALSSERFTSGR